jgi:hypothetical protein
MRSMLPRAAAASWWSGMRLIEDRSPEAKVRNQSADDLRRRGSGSSHFEL